LPHGLLLITNSIEQSPPSKANCHSTSQKIPCLIWNQKFHYCVHKSLPLIPLRRIQSAPLNISLRSILILSSHLCLGLWSGHIPSGFLIKTLHAFLTSPMHATCPFHLTVLELITLVILGEAYKLCNMNFHPKLMNAEHLCKQYTMHNVIRSKVLLKNPDSMAKIFSSAFYICLIKNVMLLQI
jgi:hypothetical protein